MDHDFLTNSSNINWHLDFSLSLNINIGFLDFLKTRENNKEELR